MWHIIQSSKGGLIYSRPETVAQFRHRWLAELYKFFHYDILAEPSWKGTFEWTVIHDKDLP